MQEYSYEYLIRIAYQSGRSFSHGADASIYRRMETSYRRFILQQQAIASGTSPVATTPLLELERDYLGQVNVVASNIISAIRHVLSKPDNRLSPTLSLELQGCINNLTKPTISSLEEIIAKAEDLLVTAGFKLP